MPLSTSDFLPKLRCALALVTWTNPYDVMMMNSQFIYSNKPIRLDRLIRQPRPSLRDIIYFLYLEFLKFVTI
jgi:hypothetical protein